MDDVGYLHPRFVLELSDHKLRDWVAAFEERRYGGWRNHDNLWRSTLGLDSTRGKRIIDWGCGFGIEALQFARNGNLMTLCDLTDDGLEAARCVLSVHGFVCETTRDELPDADIFYANGSLHHTPDISQILRDAPAPEARVLVYSDRAFREKGQGEGQDFVRAMDDVGGHADWYTPESLEAAAPGWRLREATYITPNGWYLTATLER